MTLLSNSIDPRAFAAAMEVFAPFEPRPCLAVAVSGGPDSMALLLLLDEWARKRDGSVLGLTVDHGLRPESAAEAACVGDWLRARGIAHEIIPWHGDKPRSAIQETARAARYALLAERCRARGILHLAVAHHADDQAETVLFRERRHSGEAGLAGMSAARSLGWVRLIRPLLGWPKSRLIEICAAFGQSTIDDPSNRTDYYARTELRRDLAGDAEYRRRLLDRAFAAANQRVDHEIQLVHLLGQLAEARPDGSVILDMPEIMRLQTRRRQAILGAAVRAVGGAGFAPARDALIRLDEALQGKGFRAASLGGCSARIWRGGLLICREPGRVEPPVSVDGEGWVQWDGRFLLRVHSPRGEGFEIAKLSVGALGYRDYAVLRRRLKPNIPAIVGAGLPALRHADTVIAVPSLGWPGDGTFEVEQRLTPLWPLAPERFTVVSVGSDIMFSKGDRN